MISGLVTLFVANLAGILVLIFNTGKIVNRVENAERHIEELKEKATKIEELDKKVEVLSAKIENLCEKVDLLIEKRVNRI